MRTGEYKRRVVSREWTESERLELIADILAHYMVVVGAPNLTYPDLNLVYKVAMAKAEYLNEIRDAYEGYIKQ